MSFKEKEDSVSAAVSESNVRPEKHAADNALLAELGYKSEFKREFSVGLSD